MPNHITSRLTATGSPVAVKAFWEAISGDVDEDNAPILIDFNKIIPMPESLDIESGSRTRKGLELFQAFMVESMAVSFTSLNNARSEAENAKSVLDLVDKYVKMADNDPEIFELGKQAYMNIEQYGVPTWYDWCYREWGTKWNAYGHERIDDNTIEFQTAWGGVPELMEKMSAQHPGIEFDYMYADEDWGYNVGKYSFLNGECTHEFVPEGGTPEAKAIATDLVGDWETEDEEEWEDEI